MIGEDDQERPRSRSLLLLVVRLLLRMVVKPFVLLFMGVRAALRPKPVRYGLVALLVLGALGWYALAGSLQQAPAVESQTLGVVSVPAANQLPQPPVVERYLKAQADFNAMGMWEAISDELKQQMLLSNATPQQLQAELDAARQQGSRYSGATYAGGVRISEGRSVYFYVLTVDTPRGSAEIPYIYVVGPDGKIESIQ